MMTSPTPSDARDVRGMRRTGAAETRPWRSCAGSLPFSTRCTRAAAAMLSTTTLWMPQAASSTERPSGSATRRRSRACRGLEVERHAAAEEEAGIVVAEHEIGVGHRRLRAAHAVAGRTGVGARRMRADLEQADLVDRRDRAAAGADLDHVDDGRLDRQAGALGEAVHARRLPASGRSRRGRPRSCRPWRSCRPCRRRSRPSCRRARRTAPSRGRRRPGRLSSRRIGKARAVSGETRPPAECISRSAPPKAARSRARARAAPGSGPSAAGHRRWRRW